MMGLYPDDAARDEHHPRSPAHQKLPDEHDTKVCAYTLLAAKMWRRRNFTTDVTAEGSA